MTKTLRWTLCAAALLAAIAGAQRLGEPSAPKAGAVDPYLNPSLSIEGTMDSANFDASANVASSAFIYGELEMAYLNPNSGTISDSLLNFAAMRLGTRYRSGGTSPSGFDCSGFVNYVYGNFGFQLPRNSGNMSGVGVPVSMAQAKKGDLIYFAGRGGGGRVGHVGIVTDIRDGIIHFIHSASSKGVTYDNTGTPYYRARMLGIRRVIR